jgi:hypothetical protein
MVGELTLDAVGSVDAGDTSANNDNIVIHPGMNFGSEVYDPVQPVTLDLYKSNLNMKL